jgi:ElaB/YqjD/DUF883 family membrane-anchored ribosome-binding protein
MSAALVLYRLQQVDGRIDQIQARLKTIQQTLENDLELRSAKNSVAEINTRMPSALKASEQRLKTTHQDRTNRV